MAGTGGGISGLAVGIATAGAVLVYAGISNTLNPLEALKSIASGSPTPISKGTAVTGSSDDFSTLMDSGPGSSLVSAALKHRNEQYSQAKRWQTGYSDCSSFVGKSLKDIGIVPPGASVTSNYLVWKGAKTISKSQIQVGDLLCSSGHIAIAMSATTAIGQQNSKRDVQVDTIQNIMFGQNWIPRRITVLASGVAT